MSACPPHPTDTPAGLRVIAYRGFCAFPLCLCSMTRALGRRAPPLPAGDHCQISAPPAFLPPAMYRDSFLYVQLKGSSVSLSCEDYQSACRFFFFPFFNV